MVYTVHQDEHNGAIQQVLHTLGDGVCAVSPLESLERRWVGLGHLGLEVSKGVSGVATKGRAVLLGGYVKHLLLVGRHVMENVLEPQRLGEGDAVLLEEGSLCAALGYPQGYHQPIFPGFKEKVKEVDGLGVVLHAVKKELAIILPLEWSGVDSGFGGDAFCIEESLDLRVDDIKEEMAS
jgi:hypothetical protein